MCARASYPALLHARSAFAALNNSTVKVPRAPFVHIKIVQNTPQNKRRHPKTAMSTSVEATEQLTKRNCFDPACSQHAHV